MVFATSKNGDLGYGLLLNRWQKPNDLLFINQYPKTFFCHLFIVYCCFTYITGFDHGTS